MTVNPARLGRNQVAVLRAAANGTLIRFDDGGWTAESKACTDPARSVAKLEPALLAEGKRGSLVTFGGPTRPGVWMGLSTAGELVLAEYDRQHPEQVVAIQRRADLIAKVAAKPGPITGDDLLGLAANDPTLGDDPFRLLARAVDGRPVIDNDTREAGDPR